MLHCLLSTVGRLTSLICIKTERERECVCVCVCVCVGQSSVRQTPKKKKEKKKERPCYYFCQTVVWNIKDSQSWGKSHLHVLYFKIGAQIQFCLVAVLREFIDGKKINISLSLSNRESLTTIQFCQKMDTKTYKSIVLHSCLWIQCCLTSSHL